MGGARGLGRGNTWEHCQQLGGLDKFQRCAGEGGKLGTSAACGSIACGGAKKTGHCLIRGLTARAPAVKGVWETPSPGMPGIPVASSGSSYYPRPWYFVNLQDIPVRPSPSPLARLTLFSFRISWPPCQQIGPPFFNENALMYDSFSEATRRRG